MLVLHGVRRRHHSYCAGCEDGFPVFHPERFEQQQRAMELWGNFSERQFPIKLQLRFEIGGSEPGACVGVHMRTQFLDIGARKREANRVRVTAVAGKQFVTRLDRVQQVEGGDRSS